VIDDGSTDDTAAIAARAGARVVAEASVLPEAGPGSGKGNVLWKALAACTGDVLCFVDADLRNFRAEYAEQLCEPLLRDPDTMFVKAYYARSFEGAPTGGGRVTELVARPLLSLLFPKIADIVQPLGGEYAGRRSALEVLPFVEGWGVELALLIDIVERFGRDAVTQVDLGVREHRNRPLDELAPQALAVLATGLTRAGLMELDAPFVELLRASAGGSLDVEPVEVRERPPIISYESYRASRAERS
jgi:glucosyl-3-phosphoglycerate synthase